MIKTPPFQNPNSPAPDAVLSELCSISVQHYGFDGYVHAGEIILHHSLEDDVRKFFEYSLSLQFPIFSVIPIHKEPFLFNDAISCEANNTSGFNYRTIHNSKTVSKHSLGKAFDVNPAQNIYITYNEDGIETYRLPQMGLYDTEVPGTLFDKHPLVHFMKEKNWTWGGDWTPQTGRTDYQHFEKGIF